MQRRTTDTDLPAGVHRLMKDGKVVPKRFVVRGAGMIEDLGVSYEVKAIVSAKDGLEAFAKLPKLREEAIARRRAKVLQKAAAAEPEAPTFPTLGEYSASWLGRRIERSELKTSTATFYGLALHKHILPKLGHLRIDEIRKRDVAEWMEEQVGVSDSVNARFRVLRTVLRAAVDRYELPFDASQGAKARRRTEPKKKKAMAAADLEKLLEAVRVGSPGWYPLVLVLARTGCRFGEATALKWSDVDHSAGRITIQRAQVRGHVGTPKNGKTRRPYMTPDLAQVLRDLRERHIREQREELAEGWIFMSRARVPDAKGERALVHLHATSLRKPLAKACKAAGITQHVSPHCLRHTANNVLRRHDPTGIVTRTQIGHSDVDMTENYSDVGLDEQGELMRRAFPAAFTNANGTSNGIAGQAVPSSLSEAVKCLVSEAIH